MIKQKVKPSIQPFFTNLKLYKDVYEAGSMVSLSNVEHLKLVMKEIGMRFTYLCFQRTSDTNRIRSLHNFAMYLIKLRKHHGDMYVIKFLKATQLAIQKKIARTPLKTLREVEPDLPLPRLTTSGLPKIIKLGDRSAIVRGALTVIRYWLSLSSLYRVLKGEFKPKLNTITDPFNGDSNVIGDFQKFLGLNSKRLLTSFLPHSDITKLEARRIVNIQKASPSSKVSGKGLFNDICELGIYHNQAIIDYLTLTNSQRLLEMYQRVQQLVAQDPTIDFRTYPGKEGRHLGQLAFKEEAAGKLRVFAMVDVFTQSIFKPLHDYLFTVLKAMPNDGTHDQSKAFDLAQRLAIKGNGSFGFDLSSATDRLPVCLQSYFLNIIFGKKIGNIWRDILVGRPYYIPKNEYGIPTGNVYYSVGQPMGALSSGAMLAMIHHLMVQYCYCQNYGYNKPGYSEYVILGDDLVLFDPKVAESYLALCKGLGVEINLTKSVVAKDTAVIEFAKRTGLSGHDVSALSFKDFISNNNFYGRLSISSRLIERNGGKDNVKLFILGNRAKKFKTRLSFPIISYLAQLVDKGLLTYEHLLSLLLDSSKPLSYFGRKLESFDQSRSFDMLKKWLRGGEAIFTLDMSNLGFTAKQSVGYKIYLIEEIKKLKRQLERADLLDEKMAELQSELIPMCHQIPFYRAFTEKKLSLELKLPIYKRSYYKIGAATVAPKFDHELGRIFLEGLLEGYYLKLLEFSNKVRGFTFPDFNTSPTFSKLTIDELQRILTLGQSLLAQISFARTLPERRTKIDNSLKILEFIRNSRTSEIQKKVEEKPIFALPTNIFPMFLLNKK